MDDEKRRRTRSPLRSFALGSIVGAAGALATSRRHRRRPSGRPRGAPAGLAAFEDAPCYLELVEREAKSYREGGEMAARRSKPE
jgi:hypothetical protein